MAYKDILVYLDPTEESANRIRFAAELAKTHGARLIAVDATIMADAEGIDPSSPTRRTFDEATRDAALTGLFVPAEKPGQGDAFTHCVDLIVAPAPGGPARDVIRQGALDRALTESGAPMLILPPGWKPSPVGRNVVIAWNGEREALRAVHDAMPLLERALKIVVFAFSPATAFRINIPPGPAATTLTGRRCHRVSVRDSCPFSGSFLEASHSIRRPVCRSR